MIMCWGCADRNALLLGCYFSPFTPRHTKSLHCQMNGSATHPSDTGMSTFLPTIWRNSSERTHFYNVNLCLWVSQRWQARLIKGKSSGMCKIMYQHLTCSNPPGRGHKNVFLWCTLPPPPVPQLRASPHFLMCILTVQTLSTLHCDMTQAEFSSSPHHALRENIIKLQLSSFP